jgi:hypothetical protein
MPWKKAALGVPTPRSQARFENQFPPVAVKASLTSTALEVADYAFSQGGDHDENIEGRGFKWQRDQSALQSPQLKVPFSPVLMARRYHHPGNTCHFQALVIWYLQSAVPWTKASGGLSGL